MMAMPMPMPMQMPMSMPMPVPMPMPMQQYHSGQVKSGHFLLNIEHFVARRHFSIAFHLMDRQRNQQMKN